MCESWSGPNEPHKKLFRNCKVFVGQFDHIRLLSLAVCCHLCFCTVNYVKTGVLQQAREMGWLQERAGRLVAFCPHWANVSVFFSRESSRHHLLSIWFHPNRLNSVENFNIQYFNKCFFLKNKAIIFWWPASCHLKLLELSLDASYP